MASLNIAGHTVTVDAQPPETTYSDFFEAFGPKSAKDKAALIWRMPSPSLVLVPQDEHGK
jgi:hypothetical protein